MDGGDVGCVARASPHQKLRAAGADRVAAAAARRRLPRRVVQLWQSENLAPRLPCRGELFAIRADTERNRQRGIAMHQHQRLAVGVIARSYAEEIADAD